MSITQIKGSQILDGTIKSEDIDDNLEKDFTKVRTTIDDLTPSFLSSKILAGDNITLNVIGAPNSAQYLAISGSAGGVGTITNVTAGTGLTGGGTSGAVSLAINDSIVATISGSRFTGNVGIKNTSTQNSPLHVVGSADATSYPTLEVEGAWVRLGDMPNAKTFTNGVGIKFGDSGVVHWSIGQTNGAFKIANTSSDGARLFTSDQTDIFNASASGPVFLSAGSSNLTLTGSAASNYTIGGETSTGTITLGRSTTSNTINIGSNGNNTSNQQSITIGSGAGLSAISIGASTGASTININAGTGNINIGTSASARTTNIATGAAAQSVTIGSTNSSSSLTLNAGTGGVSITGNMALAQGKLHNLGQATVTQASSLSTGVTINSSSGVITTVSANVGTNSSTSFTVTNSAVSSTSVVVASIGDYTGTYGSNGQPDVAVDSIVNGSFSIRVINRSSSSSTNGSLKIKFIVA